MPLPSESELVADMNQLRSYPSLYRNGSLTPEITLSMLSRVSAAGSTSVASLLVRIKEANDYQLSLTYLDAGGADERINTVVHASMSVGSKITDTFSYSGTAGAYVLQSTARAIGVYP